MDSGASSNSHRRTQDRIRDAASTARRRVRNAARALQGRDEASSQGTGSRPQSSIQPPTSTGDRSDADNTSQAAEGIHQLDLQDDHQHDTAPPGPAPPVITATASPPAAPTPVLAGPSATAQQPQQPAPQPAGPIPPHTAPLHPAARLLQVNVQAGTAIAQGLTNLFLPLMERINQHISGAAALAIGIEFLRRSDRDQAVAEAVTIGTAVCRYWPSALDVAASFFP